jgi:2-desacetyl-2-hydroxyethyl bacteriochlorophyllide A dehydrogenase
MGAKHLLGALMRAFVISGPGQGEVRDVEPPLPRPGEVVIDVERAGVCGTDVELFIGEMAYLHSGDAGYPLRIGHEWCGRVSALGADVDRRWLGQRVTGDTMLGCGHCPRCTSGRQHLCENRYEVGIRRGWPGALAEQLPMPVSALRELPDSVDPVRGALVEPGANAWRAVEAAGLVAKQSLLILGPGTIGLLCAMFAVARGIEVHVLGRSAASLDFARSLGFSNCWIGDTLPTTDFDAVIDATDSTAMPARALDLVDSGGRVVLIGIAGSPSEIDSRELVFKEATAVGILSGSLGLDGAIEAYANGTVDPSPLVAAVVGLSDVAGVLAGDRPPGWGAAPKVHVDPRG